MCAYAWSVHPRTSVCRGHGDKKPTKQDLVKFGTVSRSSVAHIQAAEEAVPQRSVQATDNVQRPWLSDSPVRIVSGSLREDVFDIGVVAQEKTNTIIGSRLVENVHLRTVGCDHGPSRRLCTRCTVVRIITEALNGQVVPTTAARYILNLYRQQ